MSKSQRALCWCAALLLTSGLGVPAYARAAHGDSWGRERFAAAERAREALNARASDERTRRDYQRVIDAYRRVYFGAPACGKADASAAAVADVQTEMGRRFEDEKILRAAIDQYSFLRREYPASKYRFDALFTSAEIYRDDLDDPRQAKLTFEEFVRRYPRHHLAEQARKALAELSQQANEKELARKEAERKDGAGRKTKPQPHKFSDEDDADSEGQDDPAAKPGRVAHVTAIRHWSTPDYTRVAIDLEQQVQFEAQRLAHPERIFFDLRDTRLAAALAGKSIDVDDGFLKKIRVAQFQPGRTRVVLEVEEQADYNAYVQPNPYRLIIDIRAKSLNAGQRAISLTEMRAKPDDALPGPLRPLPNSSPTTAIKEPLSDDAAPAIEPEPASVAGGLAKDSSVATRAKMPPVKKIVEADDDEKPEVAALEPADLRPEITSSQKASPPVPLPVEGSKSAHKASERKRADKVISERSDISADQTPIDQAANSGKTGRRGRSKAKHKSSDAEAEIDAREAKPTAAGDRSLTRALGLKIGKIVIDPGHGGHDTGTIGPNGLEEKDLVLGVAKRLGKLLQSRMGAEVIYTRQDDTFIPLETRTAIANEQQADLFVSIHANSSSDRDARGVETYYLNFTSNPDALEVAARENAVSDKSIHELQDLVKKIALKEKIEESREFASDVQQALHTGLAAKSAAIRDRGVKKAPFIVLIGANMPSILAEISFVSNPTDERKLETAEYRQRIAESLYHGISRYVNGLSGVRVARSIAKGEGQ
ncbi:MAG TPA: N-acetylmuramoyl-L-alanine amidase [Terriglobales bacterium]|nr:N-acetylmuramoyl-L-alanine amidase [Terriglobales bacterium]